MPASLASPSLGDLYNLPLVERNIGGLLRLRAGVLNWRLIGASRLRKQKQY